MNTHDIPVLLLTGYLGSGKTTLLNRILANRKGIRFAVIVNDIGEINIDAALIQKGGVVGGDNSGDLVALENGCICCTLQNDLVDQLSGLVNSRKFDYIVIEASGICEPEPIAQTICSMAVMDKSLTEGGVPKLDCIVTVVDTLRLKSEFDCGDTLHHDAASQEEIENLIVQQIEFCNVILLNKISEVDPTEAARIKAIIHTLQPKARIIECDYADIDISDILDTHEFDFEKVATSATWIHAIEGDDYDLHDHNEECHHHDGSCNCHHHHHHHDGGEAAEYGIETMVYYRRQAFDMNRFDYLVTSAWPRSIIRTKGIIYFKHDRDMSYLFEQAGIQKKLTRAGLWYATADASELEILMAREPGLQRDWDPVYGDRMIKLVIIGQHLDKKAITEALDDCLEYR